ncbi:unnamed protein product [Didymodactylos carnosus]|uniref:Uncharacterized protein n=1 Tax=Didymodactylos carnosus TaxID=1234261 RepID=A0A8S2E090_9BILA|nr:unnamed protein product [Didymodactylos carnosus]CAF3848648.1 unnamed protein product [Didymodactylos carnosus]
MGNVGDDDDDEKEKYRQLQPISLPPIREPPFKRRQVDPDIFRKAYDKALSVARSKMLRTNNYFIDTTATTTNHVLYSYFSHTPYCIFKPATCTHKYQQGGKTSSSSTKKLKPNQIRKSIFNDVIVENYIRW